MSRLNHEIHEQPDVIRTLLAQEADGVGQIVAAIRAFDPAFVCIAARGTSDNAARYAQYLFGSFAQLPVMLATPSLHTIYQASPRLGRALVIGISQSGQAEDVRQVLADGRAQGALTLAITNYADSPMARTAEYHLALHAGEEESLAATKTYTAQLTLIAMLAVGLSGDTGRQAELMRLPGYVAETLEEARTVADWAQRYRYMERFAVIGRGYNYATAFEISLKVKELCYIPSEGYSEADFRHGPIAIVERGFPVMVVAPQGALLNHLLDLADKLAEREAECLVISNDAGARAKGIHAVAIPAAPEWLTPIFAVIPGQVFAMHQAIVRGYAVDRPRGLTKVTVTR